MQYLVCVSACKSLNHLKVILKLLRKLPKIKILLRIKILKKREEKEKIKSPATGVCRHQWVYPIFTHFTKEIQENPSCSSATSMLGLPVLLESFKGSASQKTQKPSAIHLDGC